MVAQMNGPYSISNFFILFFKTYFIASKLLLNTPESITLLNCQCFLTMYSYYNSCFFEKDCIYKNNCVIRLHDADLEHSLMKEKNRCSYVLLPIFMFWHSRFSYGNLKDANCCMFSWCITTSILSVCSWYDMALSPMVQ